MLLSHSDNNLGAQTCTCICFICDWPKSSQNLRWMKTNLIALKTCHNQLSRMKILYLVPKINCQWKIRCFRIDTESVGKKSQNTQRKCGQNKSKYVLMFSEPEKVYLKSISYSRLQNIRTCIANVLIIKLLFVDVFVAVNVVAFKFRQRPHNAAVIWKLSFISTVDRPSLHTNPSRKWSFLKTLFKPDEYETEEDVRLSCIIK